MSNKFRFWVPLDEIKKSKDKDGNVVMKLGGIASTARKDMDNESLNPAGFDISYLQNTGVVNWNHSKSPEAVIGEPTKTELRKEGLYVESVLYPDNPLAKSVYELAEILRKNSKTRRLGYSIEGKALERDPLDKAKVTKAAITGLALTVSPKNPDSVVDIIKGNFHEVGDEDLLVKSLDEMIEDIKHEVEIEKSLESDYQHKPQNGGKQTIIDITRPDGSQVTVDEDYCIKINKSTGTKSARPVIKEDVEGKLKDTQEISKGEAIEAILEHNPVISIEKAHSIFETIKDSAMKKNKKVTEDLLHKALVDLNIEDDLSKGHKGGSMDVEDDGEDDDDDEVEESAKPKMKKAEKPDMEKANKAGSKDEKMYGDEKEEEEYEDDGKPEDDDEDEEEEEKPAPKKKALKKANAPEGKIAGAGCTNGGDEQKLSKGLTPEAEELRPYDDSLVKGLFEESRKAADSKFQALGILMKGVITEMRGVRSENAALKDEIASLHTELEKANITIEEVANNPFNNTGRKSVSKATERQFEKGLNNGDMTGGNSGKPQLSLSRNRKQVLNILDDMTFAKGVDPDLAKALTLFESSGELSQNVAKQIELEKGVTIVN